MKFNSKICTSVEESKRLLELGLKKETADMKHIPYSRQSVPKYFEDTFGYEETEYVPAWSLHRLMEIAEADDIAFLDISKIYNTCIEIIAERIFIGLINPEYLEEQK